MDWYPMRGDGGALWGRPFFGDERLDAQLRALSGAMWRPERELRCLALPYAPGAPFPLTELFCFARVEAVCGRRCVVYCVDASGRPVMPPKS